MNWCSHDERSVRPPGLRESLLLLKHVFQDKIGKLDHKRPQPCIFLEQRHQLGVHISIEAIIFVLDRWRLAKLIPVNDGYTLPMTKYPLATKQKNHPSQVDEKHRLSRRLNFDGSRGKLKQGYSEV